MSRGRSQDRRPGRLVLFGRTDDADSISVADVLRQESVGGVVMLAAALLALVWANAAPAAYAGFRHLEIGPLSLEHWASDGLLTIFFFVAGLELKRELTVGSLSRPAEALVPVVAAVCGMAVPAGIYLLVNVPAVNGRPEGWAIPMATDIAFALAILAVAAPSLPNSLRAFLLTLAIVDDLGAIAVIAVVFTDTIRPLWVLGAALGAALWWLLQRRRVRGWYLFLPLGLLTWWCMLQTGVHATIAGVLLGLLSRSSATDTDAPVHAWEHRWHPLSAGFAVPVFALVSAGVAVTPATLRELAGEPVTWGIVGGLVLGKILGVFGGAYLTARFTRAELTSDLRWSEVASVSILAGVGFTVALLISDLAFPGDPTAAEHAKAAVLIASLLAGLLAAVSLRRRASTRPDDLTH